MTDESRVVESERANPSGLPGNGPDAESILRTLGDPETGAADRRRAVIDAEVVSFPSGEAGRLKAILLQFIREVRNSDNPADLVAVGSAVRKFVAMMDEDDLPSLAVLLDADHNVTVPVEVELEVTKTLVRWLAVHPPERTDAEPGLADCLCDLADTYLKPRMLAREKFGAVALNAVLALFLLRSSYTNHVLKSLKGLRVAWFTELVARRAGQIRRDLLRRCGQAEADTYSEGLSPQE
jgi:hypothetical protein